MRMADLLAPFLTLVFVTMPADAGPPRSAKAKAEFKRMNPCPATGSPKGACPGYVVDHIKALACGGMDAPENMQWQAVEEAKAKDKWERKGCGRG